VAEDTLLRLARTADAEAIAAIYRPIVETTAISFETEPPTADEMAQRIRQRLVYWPWLVCDRGGDVLGYAYGSRFRDRAAYQWSVEVTVYVNPRAHRSGVGRALYTSLFRLLALQGFYNAYAGITLPNEASVGLHEAMGFLPAGVYRNVGFKFDLWHDVSWWSLELKGLAMQTAAPVDLPALVGHPGFEAALRLGLSHLGRR